MFQESRPATEQWRIEKAVARSSKGVVAAQNAKAAEVGCEILRAGGNAVDAAIATAFALAVVEPWMSGLGGCGYLMTYRADRAAVEAIDFGTIAPTMLDPSAFGLLSGAERDEDLFGWPRVIDDRNVHGPLSIGVPGSVAGLALASERHGRLPWKELLAPAIALARAGHSVDWWTTLKVAGEARALKVFPAASDIWLPDGLPPVGTVEGKPHIDLGNLPQTLERLGEAGARDFYEGDISRDLLTDLAEAGAFLSSDDLSSYQAQAVTPLSVERLGATISVLPGLNAGPTYLAALKALPQLTAESRDEEIFVSYATALWTAYEARLANMGHDGDFAGQGSTTHLSVADGEGNLVSLTNTLLSLFGSKILSPRTGVLMNNGMMWFDPRPGRPNSLAAGKRPLSNMCPMIATRGGQPWFALGASGGRRIMPAVFQFASFMIDLELEPAAAAHQPRINVDGGAFVEVDGRLGAGVLSAIRARLPAKAVEALVTPNHFANPLLAGIEDWTCFGTAQVQSPVSAALEA